MNKQINNENSIMTEGLVHDGQTRLHTGWLEKGEANWTKLKITASHSQYNNAIH